MVNMSDAEISLYKIFKFQQFQSPIGVSASWRIGSTDRQIPYKNRQRSNLRHSGVLHSDAMALNLKKDRKKEQGNEEMKSFQILLYLRNRSNKTNYL